MRRVVITGMGIVSPLGAGLQHNWKSLLNAQSGISRISGFETDDLAVKSLARYRKTGARALLIWMILLNPKNSASWIALFSLGLSPVSRR